MSDIDSLDVRLRSVELAVAELGTIARYTKYLIIVVCASFGLDITGAI